MTSYTALNQYDKTCFRISEQVTRDFSTSFYAATRQFDRESRDAIFSIYGFVRFADEIVDSFHDFPKETLLIKFESDYYEALKLGISLNPILHSFQLTVKKYNIADAYVQAFLQSMKNDLSKTSYKSHSEMSDYIYGSADVVGLMCLKVFYNGDEQLFRELEESAAKLGSAFQKVNFLRDLKNDIENLDRHYFPDVNRQNFDESKKADLVRNIERDFAIALQGMKRLPFNAKLPVYVAYYYYLNLLKKIRRTPAPEIISKRIRISNLRKFLVLLKVRIMNLLNML
jgi:15-cis-phytoene synthase